MCDRSTSTCVVGGGALCDCLLCRVILSLSLSLSLCVCVCVCVSE